MHLHQLTGEVEHYATIGGKEYLFCELPIEALGRLQVWINKHTPHPLLSLKGQLDGLPANVAAEVADRARQEAKHWPPVMGTAAGALALLGSELGQMEALYEGLKIHHPEVSRAESDRLYRILLKDAGRAARLAKRAGIAYDGEGEVKRIFGVLFGTADYDEETALPKA